MAATKFGRRVGIVAAATVMAVPVIGGLAGTAAYAAPTNAHVVDHSSNGTAGTFGDPSKAQPLSTADLNPGGANNGGDCGAYCSTRDGSASANGNPSVSPAGRPCAGCVGRADNKNPKGQASNGSDSNNGYECDGNHGIGVGNPAHTGCTTTVVTGGGGDGGSQGGSDGGSQGGSDGGSTPGTPGTPGTPNTPGSSAVGNVALGGITTVVKPTVTPVSHTPSVEVLGERVVRTPGHPAPQGAQVAAAAAALPYTGAPTALLVVLGLLSLGSGLAFVLVGRRRSATAAA